MAAQIEAAAGTRPTLTPGGRGEFTVTVDGAVVAAKRDGIWPDEAEATAAVVAALRGSTAPDEAP